MTATTHRNISQSHREGAPRTNGERRQTVRRPQGPSRRFRRGMALTLIAAGAASGAVAEHYIESAIDKAKENSEQPACDVPVRAGDNLTVVRGRIADAGDSGSDPQVLIGSTGHKVRSEDNTPGFYLNDSKGMRPGDRVEFQHVDPQVCLDVGGQVVKQAQK